MAIYNANINEAQINFPKDDIICQKYIAGIPGGRALDVDADYPLSVIYAGTPVIKKDGNYKPFPLVAKTQVVDEKTVPVLDEDGNPVYKLGTLPTGYAYAGILYKSIKKNNPAAAILIEGVVNEAAVYFPLDDVKAAIKAAFPAITFVSDEEATDGPTVSGETMEEEVGEL